MYKLKPFVFYIFFIVTVSALCAEAPELKNVMPNSWRKVTRLSAAEEQAFMRENSALLDKSIHEYMGRPETSLTENNKNIPGTTRVYYEPVGEEKFYRLITINSGTQDFTDQWELQFIQALTYEFRGRLVILAIGAYNTSITTESYGTFAVRTSLDIIRSGGRAKGILATRIESPVYRQEKRYTHLIKEQPWAINDSEYILMNDLTTVLRENPNVSARLHERGIYLYEGMSSIMINTEDSYGLIDPNIPLRYGLQNAFDGDPATSYVENTEDDLIKMYFGIDYGDITAIAIINGFAQNTVLYEANNRVKEVEDDKGYGEKYLLRDNNQTPQILKPYGNSYIYITDIYRGNKYNDTCIAELNIKVKDSWLFGDIDE